MKDFKQLFYTIFTILMFSVGVKAQLTQNILFGDVKTYAVDTQDGANGTEGSTYTWSVFTTDATPVDITNAGSLTITSNTVTGNSITINWGTTAPGDYTLKVVESMANCIGTEKLINVNIRNVGMPTLTPADLTICNTANAMFTIAGAEEGTQIAYTITGGTSTDPNPITVGANGEAIIEVTPTAGATEIIVTLTQMTLTNGTVIPIDPAISATTDITVIQTSEITFD